MHTHIVASDVLDELRIIISDVSIPKNETTYGIVRPPGRPSLAWQAILELGAVWVVR
jgi:hypothetical protein